MNAKNQIRLFSTAFATLLCASAYGAVTTNLAVSAQVGSECSIAASPTLGFGSYSPLSGSALDATGNLSVSCTTGSTAPTIALNDGANPGAGSSGVVPVRQMASGANRLGYFLYQDAARTTNWGDGVTAKAVSTPDGIAHNETIYGRVTGGQNKPNGSYTDTVLVTISF